MPRVPDIPTELATPEEIAEARELYGSDELEIDEGAEASRGEGGLWVQAWVWLARPESAIADYLLEHHGETFARILNDGEWTDRELLTMCQLGGFTLPPEVEREARL